MKKIFLILSLLSVFSGYTQTNEEIAGVYLKRAKLVIEESIDYKEAKVYFEKALKFIDSVNTADMAKLGTIIYFEIGDYKTAKEMSGKYFDLYKKRKNEEYLNQVELAVLINDELDKQIAEEQRLERERILKEKYAKYIDSLETVWKARSDELSIVADTILDFNKNQIALFKSKQFYGAIDDTGNIVVPADTYEDVVYFSGYFIFKSQSNNPNQLFCYDSNKKVGFPIVALSEFNTLSTHYGRVMLPRGNGYLVTYPNNAYKPLVYDLKTRNLVSFVADKEFFKRLRKADVIDSYNSDGEVKTKKTWFALGGHLGGGIHPLFQEDYKLSAFLFSIDGTLVNATSQYQHLGYFYQNKIQAAKGAATVWLNQNGSETDPQVDPAAGYDGISKTVKQANGKYQILQNGTIVLGNQQLETKDNFIKKFTDK